MQSLQFAPKCGSDCQASASSVDGDKVGGNVTGPGVPFYRAQPRKILLQKRVESIFYLCIVLSAVNSGIQTYPQYASTEEVAVLGTITNVMVRSRSSLLMGPE